MQSQQIPPDVSFGYGTEVVETGGSFVNLGWLGFAWRQKKGREAVAGGIGGFSIGVPEWLLVIVAVVIAAYLVQKLLRQ